jgi:hypothetical protein
MFRLLKRLISRSGAKQARDVAVDTAREVLEQEVDLVLVAAECGVELGAQHKVTLVGEAGRVRSQQQRGHAPLRDAEPAERQAADRCSATGLARRVPLGPVWARVSTALLYRALVCAPVAAEGVPGRRTIKH